MRTSEFKKITIKGSENMGMVNYGRIFDDNKYLVGTGKSEELGENRIRVYELGAAII